MIEAYSIFISDTHLGTRRCQDELLLQFLQGIDCKNLFLVGDIIDGWALSQKPYWNSTQTEILKQIIHLSQNSNIYFVPGNHDEFARSFEKYSFPLGNITIANKLDYYTLDGRKMLVLHGDQYDFWMKIPSSIIKFLAQFTDWKVKAKEANKKIKRYKRVTSTEAALRKHINKSTYDTVLCGHTHNPKLDETFINCGDWVRHCSYIKEDLSGNWSLNFYQK